MISITISSSFAYAETTSDLQSKIEEKNSQIKKLEEEIKLYSLEIDNASIQAKTLSNTIKTLDSTKKKINVDISLTQNKIEKTNLTISEISKNIEKTNNEINLSMKALAKSFQETQVLDDSNMVITILSGNNVNDIWDRIDSTRKVGEIMRDRSNYLSSLKSDMQKKQDNLNGQKKSLVSLKGDLSGRKKAVEYTAKEKASILAETKNKEQAFRELVKTKEQEKEQFEKELYQYESELNFTIDKSSYPPPRNGVLSWPLDNIYITQLFGKTVGAEKLYRSGSHNGIDFRASIGTKVKNVLEGVVTATGNTDLSRGCYSFGKWVLVRHDNGLSTIYAHLSVISVNQNQKLATGDLIGFSGNTGYSTGPHLHISIYATQGIRVEKYVNSIGCKNVILPIADIKAYLDPIKYFPSL
ncbi:MAG: peptidoglycan DD-metalloendopeptidase family protein [Minisyncoccia bacterium]